MQYIFSIGALNNVRQYYFTKQAVTPTGAWVFGGFFVVVVVFFAFFQYDHYLRKLMELVFVGKKNGVILRVLYIHLYCQQLNIRFK